MNKEETNDKASYTAKDISVLEGLEPVRLRPGMYIGGTGIDGLHHLVWEILDNSMDEALAGYANIVTIEMLPDNTIRISDNGRGIPVDIHEQTKKSALETIMTTLHAGGKFGGSGYKVSGGLHGVGSSVVVALSSKMTAEVWRNNKIYEQTYSKGKVTSGVKEYGKSTQTGTTITFSPDPEIFEEIKFSFKTIAERARQHAFLTKGIKITLTDAREEKTQKITFYFESGINAFVRFINKNKSSLIDSPIYISKENDGNSVEVSISYANDFNEHTYSFANNIATIEGGTHLTGFKTALTRVINDYAKKNDLVKGLEGGLTGDDVREGLTAVISVKIANPQFEGQTKAKLGNPEMKSVVESAVTAGLSSFFEEHPQDAKLLIEKVSLSARARLAARAARDTVIRKGVLEGMTLPGKLADCSEKDPAKSEIFIVEGDSAGGCFSGDTKIALTDGRSLSFKNLVNEEEKGKHNYCYTIEKDGQIGIEKILHPRLTKKNATVIKITLDNGEEITCTPDHEFMLRDGSYLEAMDISPDMSLMPLRKKLSEIKHRITISGYEMVLNPATHKWVFSHALADQYNQKNEVYEKSEFKSHKHHLDFNKLNNNPSNILRLTPEEHLDVHRNNASKTLHREDVIEKCNQIKRTKKYREAMSAKMKTLAPLLSERAKKQWSDPEYKKFMISKFLEFYKASAEYREKNRATLNQAQKNYWSNENNIKKQSEKVCKFFQDNPEIREEFSAMAKKQWSNVQLLEWRRKKSTQQWTESFRASRKVAYDKTYLNSSLAFAKLIIEEYGDLSSYDQLRTNLPKKNTNLLRLDTLTNRFFAGNMDKLFEAVQNYNHKVIKIEKLKEKVDVYDIEIPKTHNFALDSGVFVHNSAKQGRDRKFQAVLPLKGKILNVERARLDRILGSEEIKALIIAMGAGIGDEFNIEKMRYHRIIIMTDADVDGSHIRTLLLTFLFRHFKQVIDSGYVYIAQPPLFLIQSGKDKKWAHSEHERDEIIKKFDTKSNKINVQRYKGLGEMNPIQLWETTLDPENRKLLQVSAHDAERADESFSMLMGDEVPPRKRFIQTRAKTVSNLDI